MRSDTASTVSYFFFFNDTATTEIYTLSLHDALPISDFLDQGLPPLLNLRAEQVKRRKLLYVFRIARANDLCKRFRKPHEVVVLGNEIGLAVELDEGAQLRIGREVGADDALGRNAARRLARLGAALDAQQLLGFPEVAARLGQGLLAFHHA